MVSPCEPRPHASCLLGFHFAVWNNEISPSSCKGPGDQIRRQGGADGRAPVKGASRQQDLRDPPLKFAPSNGPNFSDEQGSGGPDFYDATIRLQRSMTRKRIRTPHAQSYSVLPCTIVQTQLGDCAPSSQPTLSVKATALTERICTCIGQCPYHRNPHRRALFNEFDGRVETTRSRFSGGRHEIYGVFSVGTFLRGLLWITECNLAFGSGPKDPEERPKYYDGGPTVAFSNWMYSFGTVTPSSYRVDPSFN